MSGKRNVLLMTLVLVMLLLAACSGSEEDGSEDLNTADEQSLALSDIVLGINDAYYGLFNGEQLSFSLPLYLRHSEKTTINDELAAQAVLLNQYSYRLLSADGQELALTTRGVSLKQRWAQGDLYRIDFVCQPQPGQTQYQQLAVSGLRDEQVAQYQLGSLIIEAKEQALSAGDEVELSAGSGLTNNPVDYIFFGFTNNSDSAVRHLGLEFTVADERLRVAQSLAFATEADVTDDALAIADDGLIAAQDSKYYKYLFAAGVDNNKFVTLAPFIAWEIAGEQKYLATAIPAQFGPLTYQDAAADEQLFLSLFPTEN